MLQDRRSTLGRTNGVRVHPSSIVDPPPEGFTASLQVHVLQVHCSLHYENRHSHNSFPIQIFEFTRLRIPPWRQSRSPFLTMMTNRETVAAGFLVPNAAAKTYFEAASLVC